MDMPTTEQERGEAAAPQLTDDQIIGSLTNVAPKHPALRRLHDKLNTSTGVEAVITSYDRMHHRHNRS